MGLVCNLGLVLGLGLGLGLCACLWVASTHGLLVVCKRSSVVARFDARLNLINARRVLWLCLLTRAERSPSTRSA